MNTTKVSPYEKVTARILDEMATGTVPWHRPWVSRPPVSVHGHQYRGVNAVLLSMAPYESRVWMTFMQAKERGGSVRKGESGTPVLRFRPKKKDESDPKKRGGYATSFVVFNVAQTEGVFLPEKFASKDGERDARAEDVVRDYLDGGPQLQHIGERAAYSLKDDAVFMPGFSQFDSPAQYYSTLFHELAHSTGHSTRLARPGVENFDGFGSHQYAREELIAELGAAMLCGITGIENNRTVGNSAAYLKSWSAALKDDPKLFASAASAAQAAVDFIRQDAAARALKEAA